MINDVEIMFDVLSLHQELSNIDLYLEVEVNGNKNHTNITPSGFDTDNEEDESGDKCEIENGRNATVEGDDIEVPFGSNSLEGINMANVDNWMNSKLEIG
uniref:Uncharacterized protein n=1 Tax=Lactuca sativa TaxID=4236 RepID=A0A9R1WZZ6_LACSA|nr:hypothetical protein LSAT_V11C800437790 [Lactuca sativa]